jgi:hypothetical protein
MDSSVGIGILKAFLIKFNTDEAKSSIKKLMSGSDFGDNVQSPCSFSQM